MTRSPTRSTVPRLSPSALRAVRGVAELGARFRALAKDLGAEEFAVVLAECSRRQCRFRPAIDSDFPKTSRLSRRIASRTIETGTARIRTSTIPFYWDKAGHFGKVSFALAERANPLGIDGTTIAFPLQAEAGRQGLAVFLGPEIALRDELILAAHLTSLQLFGELVGLSLAGQAPLISNRELDCLRLTADGKTSEEIAELLGLSPHTATQYLGAAAAKLDAVNRTHAVAKALRSGLIS